MTWSDLGDGERDDLLLRYERTPNKQALLKDLEEETGIKSNTLQRRLQEWRQKRTGYLPETVLAPPTRTQDACPELRSGHTYTLVNITDAHGVYCDPYAWQLAIECLHALRPDHVMWGNDNMDFGTISRYARMVRLPAIKEELEDEKRRREEIIAATPGAEIWWLADNHTLQRYNTYIWKQAPELADVEALQFHNLVGFPADHIIEEFPAGNTLRVIHGSYVRKDPGQTVKAHIWEDPANRKGRIVRSVILGHCHRFSYVLWDAGIEGLESGCLQDLRPDYIRGQRRSTNWRHGIGAAQYGKDWSRIIPVPFLVIGDRLVAHVEGNEYRVKLGRSYSGY